MRVLCLDIEGGYGGSSRSLYESIRHLNGVADIEIEVWCRKAGPIRQRYRELGVPCRVTPDMPHISPLPLLSRNLYVFSKFLTEWRKSRDFRRRLVEAYRRFDLVHLNHEGLFLLVRDLRSRVGAGRVITMHIRNFMPVNLFTRWQYRTIAEAVDSLAFITENERDRAGLLSGRRLKGRVIYNIVTREDAPEPDSGLVSDPRLKVAVLSNFAWVRGVDRLIEIAQVLRKRGRDDIVFVVAGDMTLARALPGLLGKVARNGGDLADYAKKCGVADMFRFLGHVADPLPVLAACDLLAKPTREHNPWGRDILEAMAFGKPPMSVGTYDRFVENGVTGVLHAAFDAGAWADEIIRLADDGALRARLGKAAARRVGELCDGPSRARDLLALWQSAAKG